MKIPSQNKSLNKHDKVYHQLTFDILTSDELNFRNAVRPVVDTIGVFGSQVKFDLRDGSIPFSATKPIGYKSQLYPEIVGFLRNETNLKWYLEQGMTIWTPNAFNFHRKKLDSSHPWSEKNMIKDGPEFNKALKEYESLVLSGDDPQAGDLGNFYPKQWRSFQGVRQTSEGLEIVEVDQLQDMITELIEKPTSRYAIVTAWNPLDVKESRAALAPCHNMFQAYRWKDREGIDRLNLKMYQRSADHLLGVAFNHPQYATILAYLAEAVSHGAGEEVKPGFFTHTFGDIHIYCGQGERSDWYRSSSNLDWLQERVLDGEPGQVLDDLVARLPEEPGDKGYDHMPFMLQQLSRTSKHSSPTLKINYKPLEEVEVSDFVVEGYDLVDRAEKLKIDGVEPRMAS